MTTFRIYLNRAQDLFRRFGSDGGYHVGDPLGFVHEGAVITDESEAALLEKIFEIYNIAHPVDYRERSLSVGDVVEINGCRFACQPTGWTRLPKGIVQTTDHYLAISDDELDRISAEMDMGREFGYEVEARFVPSIFTPDYDPDDIPF